jgi:hypothetical protein
MERVKITNTYICIQSMDAQVGQHDYWLGIIQKVWNIQTNLNYSSRGSMFTTIKTIITNTGICVQRTYEIPVTVI